MMSEEKENQKSILDGKTTELPFSSNALNVIAKRYLMKKDGIVIENPEEMFDRVSKNLANVESNYGKSQEYIEDLRKRFYEVMSNFEFTPAGRTLTNAGSDTVLISNCIVLNIEDSMESIFQTLQDASLLQQAGSGLGFPLHLMRPAGMPTKKSQGIASGPISFLQVYNRAFGVIKQQNRHGANMAVMRVDHPDILEFIHCKKEEGAISNFNVSVGLTNEFMEKVKNNDPNPYLCRWKDEEVKPRRIKRDNNFSIESVEEVDMTAKEIFQEIVSSAWSNGEPGCVFIDKVNETNPLPGLGRIEACNPCGEQFLHDGDVCNLGSINLEKFVKENKVDYEKLRYVTKIATIMLDNVIDVSNFPSERVNKTSRANRRIGLGIMGFADMLYQLKIPYDGEEGLETAEKVMQCIQETSHQTSMELANEKGTFLNWDKSVYAQKGIKMRNAALTNIAPTGTIAMMFDVSGGVEPYFALAYHYKAILGGKISLSYINKHLEKALKESNSYSDDIMEKIVKEGTLKNIEEIPDYLKKVFVTSMDISAQAHIKMQASFQKYCDNAISKTINFENKATKEDVLDGYLLAWSLGCKGCTVYRDGSREIQILNLNKDKKEKKSKQRDIEKSDYYEINTGQGPLHIHINYDEEGPTKVFTNISPIGTEISGLTTALGIMLSKYLENDGDPIKLIKHLNSIKGDKPLGLGPNRVDSIPHGISKVIRKHLTKTGMLKDLNGQTTLDGQSTFEKGEVAAPEQPKLHCSKCFSTNVGMVSGCKEPTCFDCGYSACG